MTNKPSLNTGGNLVQGLAAVALFAVLAIVFVTASFPEPQGFADGTNVVASIGYSMFNLDGGDGTATGEGMLAAFEIIDFVLVGALVGGVMLARRESSGRTVTGLMTDGGTASDSGSTSDSNSNSTSDSNEEGEN
ncbi:proton-conducting membrane transporter [Halobium palmae]|uniref:Proton-conducting membrane transporter n=1 Tax=Halobium palmae TaxID=1776492 RepID=A0ABD5RWT8_9EURY